MEKYNDYLHGNIGITSESITLKNFMTAWLENVVALNVKASSMQTYRTLFKTRIVPYLGEVKIQDLTPAMLDKWIRALQQAGLSYNTISSISRATSSSERIPLILLYHTGMRIGEVLGLSWSDIDFAAKKNLLGELRRWQAQQVENEKQHGGSYVYIYRENDGHIQRQSKGLSAPCGEKVSLICTRADGRLVLRETFTKVLHGEGQTIRIREYTNHAESSHAQHAEITGRNGGDFRQYADIKAETP